MDNTSEILRRPLRASRATDILTTRESQILLAYAEGCGRREISWRFRLSPSTVSHALTLAKEKLGARSVAQAAVLFTLWCEASQR